MVQRGVRFTRWCQLKKAACVAQVPAAVRSHPPHRSSVEWGTRLDGDPAHVDIDHVADLEWLSRWAVDLAGERAGECDESVGIEAEGNTCLQAPCLPRTARAFRLTAGGDRV